MNRFLILALVLAAARRNIEQQSGGPFAAAIFDVEKGESLGVTESENLKGLVETVPFAPDGKWLVGSGGDHKGWLLFLDVLEKKIITEETVSSHVHETAFSKDLSKIYGVGHNKVYIWEKEVPKPEGKKEEKS